MISIQLNKKERDFLLATLKDTKEGASIVAKIERKPITPRSRKNKGALYQKIVCELISKITGVPFTNNDDSLIQSRPMGLNGTDVILRGEAKRRFPFSVECKNCKNANFPKWVRQASNYSTAWLLFVRSTLFDMDTVTMSTDTFYNIMTGQTDAAVEGE